MIRRAMEPPDRQWIATAFDSWRRTRGWSLRGATPSPLTLDHLLAQDAVVRHVVVTAARPVALFEVVGWSQRNGFARLELMVEPECDDVADELQAFVSDVFTTKPDLRKLCVWSFEDEFDAADVLGVTARQVGRLVGHERRGIDRYVDVMVHEIWPPQAA